LTFNQILQCPPSSSAFGDYTYPWSVTVDGLTITQPPNANFTGDYHLSANVILSTIVFTVPDGTYNFTISSGNELAPGSGAVTVEDHNTVFQLN
jgi:hypothetical protein